MHRRGIKTVLGGAAMTVFLGTGGWAEEWVSPCDLARQYDDRAAGPGKSLALYYQDICDDQGDTPQPQSCMTWGTAFGGLGGKTWTQTELEELVAQCEAALGAGPANATDDTRCGEGDLECLPADIPEPDPAADVTIAPDETPQMGVDTGGCGPNLECKPPEDEPVAVDQSDLDPAPEPTPPADPALDLAFWNSVKDSAKPVLLQAYIDKFPNGTFVVIAEELLKELAAQGMAQGAGQGAAQGMGQAAAAPAAAVPTTPEPTPPATAQQVYAEAQHLMGQVFSQPVSTWNTGLQRPIALLQQAHNQGYAPATSVLGELHENGNGLPKDQDRAIAYYLEAGRGGYLEGYYRALIVLDQEGHRDGYVDTFLALYGAAPDMALDSFNAVSRGGPSWLQQHLAAAGYYLGAVDGAFGPASRAALDAYLTGAPKPARVPEPADASALSVQIQRELARVGCYHGAFDGKWGPGTTQAMRNYNHWQGESAETARATSSALEVLRATSGLVCGVD